MRTPQMERPVWWSAGGETLLARASGSGALWFRHVLLLGPFGLVRREMQPVAHHEVPDPVTGKRQQPDRPGVAPEAPTDDRHIGVARALQDQSDQPDGSELTGEPVGDPFVQGVMAK